MFLYFGMFLSIAAYLFGMWLKKKLGWAVLNPLLSAVLLVIAFLKAAHISYADYNTGAQYISYLLTPATVCLAIPLYKQLGLLKKNFVAVALGITSGVAASAASIFVMALLFKLEHVHHHGDRDGRLRGGRRHCHTDCDQHYSDRDFWKYHSRRMVCLYPYQKSACQRPGIGDSGPCDRYSQST